MDLGEQRTRTSIVSYIHRHFARNGAPATQPLPMSPKQREIAQIVSHYEETVAAQYHPPITRNQQPTIEIYGVHFAIGRPDKSNQGEAIGRNKTQYTWQHEEFEFTVHLHSEDGTVEKTTAQVRTVSENHPENKKTATY